MEEEEGVVLGQVKFDDVGAGGRFQSRNRKEPEKALCWIRQVVQCG